MAQRQEIHVLDKKVRLLQVEDGFRTSLDSVMLAAACPVQKGQAVLDMGCGVGGASFCVLERVADCHLTGVDIQEDHIDLARQNVELNAMTGRAVFTASDIRAFQPKQHFDHIICNPPYLEAGEHMVSPKEKKAKALGHLHKELSLQEWVDCGFHLLTSRGSLTMIHRADAVDRIIRAMGKRFGAIEIIPLWPRAGAAAKRVIIRAVKDRRSPAKIHQGIILHDEKGEYTVEAERYLREAAFIV